MAKTKAKTPKETKMELPDEQMEQYARRRLENAAAACVCAAYNRDVDANRAAERDLFDATLLLAGVISARSKTNGARPRWVRDIEGITCFSSAVREQIDKLLRQALAEKHRPRP